MHEESNTPVVGENLPPQPEAAASVPPPASGGKPPYYPHGKYSLPKTVRSLIGAHLGGLLVALVLFFALMTLMTGTGLILTIPVILGVYISSVYGSLWGMGHDDANLAHFGHITLDPLRGLKVYALAMIPFYVFSLFFLVCYLVGAPWFTGLAIAYKVVNANVWPLLNAIQPSSVREEILLWQAILMALAPVVPLPFSHLAYHLGSKDFSVLQRLLYKNKGKNKKKPRGPKPPKSQYTPSR